MTRNDSTKNSTTEHAEGMQTEAVSPADRPKRQVRLAASKPPKAEQANKAGGPSRRDQLIRMLSTRSGTDLAVISDKFGWLPHTSRAALSGLRKAGFAVIAEKRADGKPTRYRIAVRTGSASPGDGFPSGTELPEPESLSYPISDGAAPTPAPLDPVTTGPDNGRAPAAGPA